MTQPSLDVCGPYVCEYPDPRSFGAGSRWTCPRCGTCYRLTRRKAVRWWRNWSAEHGRWTISPWWARP